MTSESKKCAVRPVMWGLWALGLGLAATALPAHAQSEPEAAQAADAQPVPTDVLVVLASEQEGSIDPALSKVAALRKAPFNAFRSMRVLSRPQVTLERDKPVRLELPNGRTLKLELQQRMSDGRFKVKVSINKPNQKDYLPLLQVLASPDEPFFVAGQRHEGGMLVIGVQVGKRAVDAQ